MTLTLTLQFKGKCDDVIGPLIYDFLLMVNSKIRPNLALCEIWRFEIWVIDFDVDLSVSLKVKYDSDI